MAIFRTNPSRDVLTPQMREAMYAQLENRMRDDAIKEEIQPEIPLPKQAEEPPMAGKPRRKMIDFPGGMATPADPASAGYEPGQPTMTPDASLDLLKREANEKLDALPASPMQGIDSTSTQDPLIDAALNNTVKWEGRTDRQGNLVVYNLPSGDEGGTYEVAGINDKFHPGEARRLANLPPEQR
ncbi:MAG: hypothetical protein EBZ44_06235, partial [Verrucomicrobia bacterium]|nr:hypothetical protein [Verrucomicrobiota bacterium]